MDVIFASNELKRCYEESRRAVRKWDKVVARKYVLRIDALFAAAVFDDLYLIKALHLHQLGHDRAGQYGITIQDRWRLVIVPEGEDKVRVEEVTRHYGQ